MVNKKLLLLTAIAATGCLWGMEDDDMGSMEMSGYIVDSATRPNIDAILALCMAQNRDIPGVDTLAEESLDVPVMIVGRDVMTPLSELEEMDAAEMAAFFEKFSEQDEPGTPQLNLDSLSPARLAKLKTVITRRVWRDDAFLGSTDLRFREYLAHAHPEQRKLAIEYLVNCGTFKNSFLEYHRVLPTLLAQMPELATLPDDQVKNLSAPIQAQVVLAYNAMGAQIMSRMLIKFGLEVAENLTADATIIAKTKAMLAEFSR